MNQITNEELTRLDAERRSRRSGIKGLIAKWVKRLRCEHPTLKLIRPTPKGKVYTPSLLYSKKIHGIVECTSCGVRLRISYELGEMIKEYLAEKEQQ